MSSTALSSDARIGVLGGGAMGAGIAQVALSAGHPVVLLEVSEARTSAAHAAVTAGLHAASERGKLPRDAATGMAHALQLTTDIGALRECALVIEAVAEDLAIKQSLFADLERVVPGDCLLATNTSSLSVESIAASLSSPERLVGMHFFNPAPVMPLVEIVSGLGSSPEVVTALEQTAQGWGKQTIRCRSTPGFVVNRIARPFYSEALALLETTTITASDIDALFREAGGFRMGPLQVTDLIGQDVNAAVTESVWRALNLDPRYRPSALQRRMVDAGRLGRKSGHGFYDRTSPSEVPPPPTPVTREQRELTVEVGPAAPLAPLVQRLDLTVLASDDLDRWIRLPSGALLGLTDGRPATEHAHEQSCDVVLLDLVLDWSRASRVGATSNESCSTALRDEINELLAPLDVTWLPDEPGLVIARTVALLVDEAVALSSSQAIAPAELDRAVTLALGYPLGPLSWGQQVGASYVVTLLDAMERLQPGGRFRACGALRRAALSGRVLDG